MKKILIVDDEEALRFLIRETLELGNYILDEAKDGKEALEKVFEFKPDLMVLDVMMPEMNGFDVAKILAGHNLNLEIIMVTAKVQHTDKEEAIKCGIKYFVSKPFSPIELFQMVNEILGDD